MGVIDRPIGLVPAASLPPGEDQALLLQAATGEVQDKGFIVATLDNVVNWARTKGSSGFPRTPLNGQSSRAARFS